MMKLKLRFLSARKSPGFKAAKPWAIRNVVHVFFPKKLLIRRTTLRSPKKQEALLVGPSSGIL